jgi:4'-phosphopantetheinyl transferase
MWPAATIWIQDSRPCQRSGLLHSTHSDEIVTKRESYGTVNADGQGPLKGPEGDFISSSAGIDAAAPEVAVWAVHLDQRPHVVAALAEALTDDELERACRLRQETDRSRCIVARAALRQILGHELEQPSSSLRFANRDQGKPYLLGNVALQFNVSHSYGLCLIAVTDGIPVGVDVERIAPLDDLPTLADEILAPAEIAVLGACNDPLRLFYSCWTRKEAYVKARGDAWAVAAPDIELDLAGGASFLRLPADDPVYWSLVDLQPAPGYIGALAVRWPGVSMSLREWRLDGSFPETEFSGHAERAPLWR